MTRKLFEKNKLVFILALYCVFTVLPVISYPEKLSEEIVKRHHGFMHSCNCTQQKMIIRAEHVELSKFANEDGDLWCKCARKLEIFALDSIKFDCDLKSGEGGLSVIIIARKWIIRGRRLVDLSGWWGGAMEKAEDGNERNQTGKEGVPGLPGKNGGDFWGVYEQVIREPVMSSLKINVNGGDGGEGQEGGDGRRGEDGVDGKREDFPSPYSELDSRMTRLRHLELNVLYAYRYKNYVVDGTIGEVGGNGGDGGVGGIGGWPGMVKVERVNLSGDGEEGTNWWSFKDERGDMGEDGEGGAGGSGGRHGEGYQCTWRGVLGDTIRWWDKCHGVKVSQIASLLWAPSGRMGKKGGNSRGRKEPGLKRGWDGEEVENLGESFSRFVSLEGKEVEQMQFADGVKKIMVTDGGNDKGGL